MAVPRLFTETWGYQMIAFIFNAILYGIGMLLTAQYFQSHCSGDTRLTRLTVICLGFFSTVQMVFLSHQVYSDFVNLFGDFEKLDRIVFSAPVQLMAVFLVAFMAQMFFVSRIWIITKHNIYYTGPIVLLGFVQLGAGIAQVFLVFTLRSYEKLHSTTRVSSTQSGATAICDVVITVVLCWVLHDACMDIRKSYDHRNMQSQTNARIFRTQVTINRLILYAIERGAATSMCALLNLIFFIAKSDTFLFMIFLEPSCPLYLISVVSMLVNRSTLRAELTETHDPGMPSADASNMQMTVDPHQLGDRCTLISFTQADEESSINERSRGSSERPVKLSDTVRLGGPERHDDFTTIEAMAQQQPSARDVDELTHEF